MGCDALQGVYGLLLTLSGVRYVFAAVVFPLGKARAVCLAGLGPAYC